MTSSGRIRVMIVDAHPVVRCGIRGILEREANMDVVGEADSLGDAARQAGVLAPDVVLGDLLSGDAGQNKAADVLAKFGSTRLIALSDTESWDSVQSFFKGGGKGYVAKRSPLEHIVEAVRAVAGGGQYVSSLLRQPRAAGAVQLRPDQHALSGREAEVLALVADGMTSAEIADLLCISRRTVDTHRHRICRKPSISTRSQLVRYAQSAGLARQSADASAWHKSG